MKEYKYKINGSDYTVIIQNVEENVAEVEVNGTPYTVEMNKQIKKTVPLIKPAISAVSPKNPAASAESCTLIALRSSISASYSFNTRLRKPASRQFACG